MIFKTVKSRMIVAIVTIILISIIGITGSDRNKITPLENLTGTITTPIQEVLYGAGTYVSNVFDSIGNITKLKSQNEKLKKEVAKLKEENRTWEDIINRAEYLKNEAELKETSEFKIIDSQIIGKEPGNWFDMFIIDKGKDDGIKKNYPVVQGIEVDGKIVKEGLVGRVIEVGDDWAKVKSIIDEGSKVSFKTINTQEGGIVEGNFQGDLTGYFFDDKANVKKGDKLTTSGLGGIYGKDLYIGEIEKVTKKSDDLMKRITVKTYVEFDKLQDVYVILGNKEIKNKE